MLAHGPDSELHRRIKQGHYVVDAGAVAEAMLRHGARAAVAGGPSSVLEAAQIDPLSARVAESDPTAAADLP